MTSLQSVVGALPGYIVYFTAASLTAAQLAILLLFIRKNRPDAHLFLALTHFLAGLLFLSVLLDYSYNALIEGQPEMLYGFELRLLSLPWLMYAAAEGMSAMAGLLHGRMLRRDRNGQYQSVPEMLRHGTGQCEQGAACAYSRGCEYRFETADLAGRRGRHQRRRARKPFRGDQCAA